LKGVGEPVPDVDVWLTADERITTRGLLERGPYLLLFYLFDWTGT
jgi:hypothetical protein